MATLSDEHFNNLNESPSDLSRAKPAGAIKSELLLLVNS